MMKNKSNFMFCKMPRVQYIKRVTKLNVGMLNLTK